MPEATTNTETTAAPATATTTTGTPSTATTTTTQAAGGDAATQEQSTQGASTSTATTADTSTTTNTDPAKAGATTATDAPKTGAPEAYSAFTLPEGVTLSPEVTTELTTVAKKNNLSQESAQEIVNLGAKLQQTWSNDLKTKIADINAGWETASKSDKEFGGDNFEVNVALANQAARTFGSPAFMQLMKESGLEKHPEVIRTFLAVGKAISPDTLVGGDGGSPAGDAPRSALAAAASKLYGKG